MSSAGRFASAAAMGSALSADYAALGSRLMVEAVAEIAIPRCPKKNQPHEDIAWN